MYSYVLAQIKFRIMLFSRTRIDYVIIMFYLILLAEIVVKLIFELLSINIEAVRLKK